MRHYFNWKANINIHSTRHWSIDDPGLINVLSSCHMTFCVECAICATKIIRSVLFSLTTIIVSWVTLQNTDVPANNSSSALYMSCNNPNFYIVNEELILKFYIICHKYMCFLLFFWVLISRSMCNSIFSDVLSSER